MLGNNDPFAEFLRWLSGNVSIRVASRLPELSLVSFVPRVIIGIAVAPVPLNFSRFRNELFAGNLFNANIERPGARRVINFEGMGREK